MINFLTDLLVPVSIALFLLLLIRRPLLTHIGARGTYYTWLLLPLSLAFYSLPLNILSPEAVSSSIVVKVFVDTSVAIQQGFHINWVAYLWLGVSIGFISCWLTNHYNFTNNLKLEAVDVDDAKVDLPKSLEVYQSENVFSPMLIGFFKQKLIIPDNFDTLYNQEQQSLILQHEICHYSRHDLYWNLLAFTILALFWFHPLVWLAYFRFRCDQELACDHTVLAQQHKASRINYSKALLITAQTAPPLAFAQLAFNAYKEKSIMNERIEQIRANTSMPKAGFATLILLSVMTLSSMTYAGNIDSKAAKHVEYQVFPIKRVEPVYPKYAAAQSLTGSVRLKFDVLENGETNNISVVTSKPKGIFDQAAIDALSKWTYKSHDHGVVADNLVQLDFVLNDSSTEHFQLERIKVQNHQ